MTWISDDAVTRLRTITEEPDFAGTRYRLLRKIARGGMGVVYEAEDAELQRRVAIKVLAIELSTPEAAERMRREARVIAGLEHPGIVPLHDVGALPDGRIFYSMKLVRGRTLDEIVGAPSLRLFLRVCEAVAFAHDHGVVHCDLKPSNVMVGEFGEVLVMDWGVARLVHEADGAIGGTRGFMSPEQERGEPVDGSADVFALGSMLRGLTAEPRTRRLNAILGKAMAAEKSERYGDAQQLAADLARYLDGEPLAAYRENAIERIGRWLDRNRALVAVIAAYLIMRAIVFLVVHR
jgi:eukaryotic-like serine/threonine-protein kinase